MSYRITEKMLNARVDWLNELTNNPVEAYTRKEGADRATANIGNFNISHAYGGVSLHQMQTDGGGVRDVFSCGHIPKRELFERICAFMDGVQAGKTA